MKLNVCMDLFLQERVKRGDEAKLFYRYQRALKVFEDFARKQDVYDVREITVELLHIYQRKIAFFKTTAGGSLWSLEYRNRTLMTLRRFLRWLENKAVIPAGLSREIRSTSLPQQKVENILTKEEIIRIIEAADMTTDKGCRDRLILELFYATGIQAKELRQLKLGDVNTAKATLRINPSGHRTSLQGRTLPLGPGVCDLVQFYVERVREKFLNGKKHDHLFCGITGIVLDPQWLKFMIRRYADKAQVQTKIYSTHIFREACAVHMLQNGASARYVQKFLGHATIYRTQIYNLTK